MDNQIDILLTTYNGEAWLGKQLDSLLRQNFTDWRLLIRDDGSTDNTPKIIHEYQKDHHEKIILINKENVNLGVLQSFSLIGSYSDSKYIMFCDQDDVWLPDKIGITYEKMREVEGKVGTDCPVLIHTDSKVTDKSLNIISNSFWKYQNLDPRNGLTLNRLIVQNSITGNTIMINKSLRNMVSHFPPQAIMHDWWLGLVASAFGVIEFIPTPTLLYRQHHNNAVGAKKWGLVNSFSIIKSGKTELKTSLNKTRMQASVFLDSFREELDGKQAEMLNVYSTIDRYGYFSRRFNLFKYRLFKNGWQRNLGMVWAI